MEQIARESGISRMTLHRRGVTRATVFSALTARLEDDYRRAMWPALTASGSGRERLARALAAECDVAEQNLELLGALEEGERNAIFHDSGGPRLTRSTFTEPLVRLLRDGAADGSLRECDPQETATVLFNLIGFTYRHLRVGHGWDAERARGGVLEIALRGVVAEAIGKERPRETIA